MEPFYEKQTLNKGPLLILYRLLRGLSLTLCIIDISQIIAGRPFGDKPASNMELIILTVVITSMYILFYKTALVTCVDKEGVKFKWLPFHNNYTVIKWSEIKEHSIINNHSLKMGFTKINNRSVNDVWGKTALRLLLNDGREIFVGTQQGNEMERCLATSDIHQKSSTFISAD